MPVKSVPCTLTLNQVTLLPKDVQAMSWVGLMFTTSGISSGWIWSVAPGCQGPDPVHHTGGTKVDLELLVWNIYSK